ncbi:MAG: O-antigen ligase/tetratricopeptide (TPR) repeat protein [Verrucomicrobiales bacterium]|jgi:O-antigen ligase/tetratricopeptide (TPR) repeat protein
MSEREYRVMDRKRIVLVSATTLLACVAHESMSTWTRVLLLIAMAVVIPFVGRQIHHSRSTWIPMVFALLWAGLCFLPGDWRALPDWLAAVVPNLPNSEIVTRFITPQRWISSQALLTFSAFMVWIACITGVHWHTEERKLGLSLMTAGIAIIGVTFLFLKISDTPWPGAEHDNQFGPFANRNQTAILFTLGAVCATGLLLENGKRHWQQTILWCTCLGIFAAAVTQAGSRAGVLTMASGVLTLSGWWSLRSRQWMPLAIGASALLLTCSYLILEGGRLTERIGESLTGTTTEGRVLIWKDTIRLISDSPWLGTGLGNFEPAFAQARIESISEYHVRHPESDWLWLATEIGIPGTLAVIALAVILLRRIPWKQLPHVRSRHHLLHITAAVAVLQFAALSFIDVPGHRIGSLLPVVLLLGMAINNPPRVKRETSPEHHSLDAPPPLRQSQMAQYFSRWALPAIPLLTAVCWITLPSSHRVNSILNVAKQWKPSTDGPSLLENRETIAQALAIAPLDWRGYFLSANQALTAGPHAREAQRDFQIARSLMPHSPSLPRQEARAWITSGLTSHAIPAWREQLHCDPTRAAEHFGVMLGAAKGNETLTHQLIYLTAAMPDLQLIALKRAKKGPPFSELLAATQLAGDNLRNWTPTQLASLFEIWLDRGDQAHLEASLIENPRWANTGWQTLFKLFANRGDHADAASLAATHLEPFIQDARGESGIEHLPDDSIRSLRQSFSLSKGDMATGLQLARIEVNEGRLNNAVKVLSDLTRLQAASSTPPVLLLKAWCHQQLEQHEQASSAYSNLIEASAKHPDQAIDWLTNSSKNEEAR